MSNQFMSVQGEIGHTGKLDAHYHAIEVDVPATTPSWPRAFVQSINDAGIPTLAPEQLGFGPREASDFLNKLLAAYPQWNPRLVPIRV